MAGNGIKGPEGKKRRDERDTGGDGWDAHDLLLQLLWDG